MATLLVLDVKNNDVKPVQCSELDDFYRELDADVFNIARRKIGGRYYDIFVDDMGLWREDPVVSAISPKMEPMLVGNLVFANHDDAGETTSLTDEDMDRIVHNLFLIRQVGDEKEHMVVMCEY